MTRDDTHHYTMEERYKVMQILCNALKLLQMPAIIMELQYVSNIGRNGGSVYLSISVE